MHLVEVLFSFPTLAFTAPLVLCVFYWIFVLVGALDLDSGGNAEGGHADGGHADGGHADGGVDGHADGALDAHGDAAHDHGHDGGDSADADGGDADLDDGFLATMMSALKLRKVPLTVRLSLLSLFGWLAAGLTTLSIPEPSWPMRIGIFLGALVVSVLVTSLVIRPLVPIFDSREAGHRDADLVGKIAIVSTGSVSETFGQATFDDGGAGLTLQVRAHVPNHIKKGTRCVIVDHDSSKGTFMVEPLPEDDLRPRIDALAASTSSEEGDHAEETAAAAARAKP